MAGWDEPVTPASDWMGWSISLTAMLLIIIFHIDIEVYIAVFLENMLFT